MDTNGFLWNTALNYYTTIKTIAMLDQSAGRTHRLITSIEDLRTLRINILNWLESNDVSQVDNILFTHLVGQINDTILNYTQIVRGWGFDVR